VRASQVDLSLGRIAIESGSRVDSSAREPFLIQEGAKDFAMR
jgi:hypothetical protein